MERRLIQTLKVSEVPSSVNAIYALRTSYSDVPVEIVSMIDKHIKIKAATSAATSRFAGRSGTSDNTPPFRDFSSLRGGGRPVKSDSDGFQEVRRWGKGSRAAPSHEMAKNSTTSSSYKAESSSTISSTLSILPAESSLSNSSTDIATPSVAAEGSISSVDEKTPVAGWRPGRKGKTFEESERSKIQARLNKITDTNYDRTKEFLTQFLDPRDTSVLTDFVNAVFDTAAMSPILCKICTRLLHELGVEYPHVRVEMLLLFQNFMLIFDDTIGTPDVTSANYAEFLDAQKRKRMRRGYSRFIAELVTLKELPVESYIELLKGLTRSLEKASASEENRNECTEYADCLKLLFETKIRPSGEWLARLVTFAKTPISELPPGLSAQSKFALLDIVEALKLV
jgi:hypothetical protein